MEIIYTITSFILFNICCNIFTYYKDFKYYSFFYKLLSESTWYKTNNYIVTNNIPKKGFILYLIESKDILLYTTNNNKIIFLNLKFNPYTIYWYYKYQKWIKDNKEIQRLIHETTIRK